MCRIGGAKSKEKWYITVTVVFDRICRPDVPVHVKSLILESRAQQIYNLYDSYNHALEHHNMYFISWSQGMMVARDCWPIRYESLVLQILQLAVQNVAKKNSYLEC